MRKILPIGKRNFVGKKFKSAKPNELNVSDKNVIKNNINKYTHQQLAIRIGKPVASVEKFIKKEKLVSTLVIEDTNDLVVVEQISKPIEAKSPQNDAIEPPKKVSKERERKVIEKSLKKTNFVRENYQTNTTHELAEKLNMSDEGVRFHLRKLKVKPIITTKPTSEKENFIRENHGKYTLDELAKELNCTTKNIRYYAKKLNLPQSHEAQLRREEAARKVRFIKENYQKYDLAELADKLRCSTKTISNYLEKLGLKPFKKIRAKQYPPEVIEFVRANYRTMTAREMSDILGNVSFNNLRRICERYRFIKTPAEVKAVKLGWNKTIFTPEEEKYIIENHGNIALALIAINLKRTRSSVINFLRREGRKITKEQYQIIKRNMSEIAQEAKRKANT